MQQASSSVKVVGSNGHVLPCQTIQILHLGLNARYTLILTGVTHSPLDIRHFQFASAHVLDSSSVYHGELLSLEQDVVCRGEARFKLQLGCSLHRLSQSAHHALFIDQTPVEILKAICKTNHLNATFAVQGLEQRLPYLAQGEVSDYDFLRQVCMSHGIVFYYRHEQNEAKLHFTNSNYQEQHHDLIFNPGNGLVNRHNAITSLRYWQVSLPETISFKGSQEGNPDTVFKHQTQNQTSIPGSGALHLVHPTRFENQEACEGYAKRLQQQLDWQREWVNIEVTGLNLQAGDCLTLSNHPDLTVNRSFRILDVCASLDGTKTEVAHPAKSTAYLISLEHKYLLPEPDTVMSWQHKLHGEPPQGLMSDMEVASPSLSLAIIHGDDARTPYLDEQGRYCVKRLLEVTQEREVSHSVRQLQPVSGFNSGMHFPLTPGTRVVLAHLYNQLDKPIIMGVLPDAKQLSPVTQANREQSIIHNARGAALAFVDTEYTQHCALYTENKKHGLFFNKEGEIESILAKSLGSTDLKSAKAMAIHTGTDLTLHSEVAHFKADNDMSFTAIKMFFFNAEQISCKASQDWLAQSTQGIAALGGTRSLTFISQEMAIEANGIRFGANTCTVTAGHQLTLKSQNQLEVSCKASKLTLSDAIIQFQAPQIIFNAQSILKNQGIEALVLSRFGALEL
ncbi:contractile injection system protein, VgrG/Pvc8 family [Legionella yabuuchiae]|uniref:contractile injection system protein, VgrG/Pvc8 family n=1 Tax=Legionella yabuuchiae TaxID=376727 RepID=UPI0010568B48|nr:contractile injection system protein, VgrG/Pvc8 family [Legionella yabuuchiae]